MRNNEQLPRGRQILGITTPPVREKELAPPPTKEEARAANAGELAGSTRTVEKVGGNKFLKAVLGGGAVVGAGAVAYETVPAFHQAVDSAFLDHIKGLLSKETPVPSTFDNNADRQVIKAGVNTVAVAETELKKAYEAQSAQNTDGRPTVVFPVRMSGSEQKVDYEYQKPLTGFKDSKTGEPVVIEKPGTIKTNLGKGIEIVVPATNAEVFQFQPTVIDGKEYFLGLWIKFQQNGETYAFGVSSADVRTFIPIGEAVNAPLVPVNERGTLLLADAKNGLKLPVGTPVARVDRSTNLEEGFNFSKYNPNNPHINARWESIRPNFVTDSSTGQTNLILPK